MAYYLENRWKCPLCKKVYTETESAKINNECCGSYMIKYLVRIKN